MSQFYIERENRRVYFIEMTGHSLLKIGASSCPLGRKSGFQSWSPYELKLCAQAPGYFFAESMIMDHFRDLRFRNEWFRLTPALAAFVGRVAATGELPEEFQVDELLYGTGRMLPASTILRRLGMTAEQFAEHVGIKSTVTALSWNASMPSRYIGTVLRLAKEAGVNIPHADWFHPLRRAA